MDLYDDAPPDQDGEVCRLAALLDTLPPGRRRVAAALVGIEPPLNGQPARTRRETTELLGLHPGTISRTLRAIRLRHPEAGAALWAERKRQLAERHRQALFRNWVHNRERWRRRMHESSGPR